MERAGLKGVGEALVLLILSENWARYTIFKEFEWSSDIDRINGCTTVLKCK